MKILLLNILFIFSIHVYSQVDTVDDNISLNCNKLSLGKVLENIRIKSEINFIYDDKLIDDVKLTCRINNLPVSEALDKIFKKTELSYKIYNEKDYVIYFKKKIPAENKYKAAIVNEHIAVPDSMVEIIKPKIVSSIPPVYPYEAVQNKIEGKVGIKIFISMKGDVVKSVVTKSSGSTILDSAAIYYVSRLKFIPARVNGNYQNIWMTMLLDYYIENL